MATLVRDITHWYHDLMYNRGDERTSGWPMMATPLPTLIVCLCYAYFAKVLGPAMMHNRKPFKLRRVLIFYNLFQTIFSAWIFYEYLMSGWWGDYSFRCQPVDYSRSDKAMRMAMTCWWYYFSKFTEFFDTLFFILRKKNEHVSTLHVIHHGMMPMSVWFGVKFTPGGHSTFFALLNTFVHIVMYFYYMISAMGPEYQKYIWWKKHLTTFQMVQFVMIFAHQFQLLFTPCDYPKSFMVYIALHGVLFLFLFSDFYRAKYRGGKPKNDGVCMVVYNNNGTTDKSKYNDENGYTKAYPTHFTSCYSHGEGNGYLPPTAMAESDKDK
ncbi:elongation of very long chain fatty acids protein AAEL008004-like isoform X2 [Cimex lectularius]|nr:elongation of very long chain fatty acids protein AAEL008004-like isoform X2 [Cimex lectularius]XP_014260823.1 elongation of very long chain fatty acids protein AAEL008004-like isoform X2 [Cimex lectularius]XP_024082944.1 elongation of very long chain fatty acids protein AAEL008004-like isoform X2 [Cimex lectularius]